MYDTGVPVLGICYGAQLIAQQLGGTVARTGRGEYGRTVLELASSAGPPSVIFAKVPPTFDVWMSHADSIGQLPDGFSRTASTPDAPVAAPGGPRPAASTASSSTPKWSTPKGARTS